MEEDSSFASSELIKQGDGDQFSDLSLRPMDLSDIDDFMVWASDDKVTRFCSYGPYTSREEGIGYILDVVVPHPWFMAICLHNDNDNDGTTVVVGAISVSANNNRGGDDECRGELGYVIASQYWGKGIATRAVKMVRDIIFVEWPHLERLEALVDVENVGSQMVLLKAGFLQEGVLRKYFIQKGKTRDMVMFSFLSTDPRT